MDKELFREVDQYIGSLLAEEDDALKQAKERTEQAGMPDISISPNQGKFLQIMAQLVNAGHILEIGTLGGYSTIWLARALPEGGRLISLELDEGYAAVARENVSRAGLERKVEIRTGRALDILPQMKAEGLPPFDMVFIDADKPPYTEYFQWALQLARPGTVIIADNVVRKGAVLDADSTDASVQGVRRFNEYLAACQELNATIIPTVGIKGYDGMAIAVLR